MTFQAFLQLQQQRQQMQSSLPQHPPQPAQLTQHLGLGMRGGMNRGGFSLGAPLPPERIDFQNCTHLTRIFGNAPPVGEPSQADAATFVAASLAAAATDAMQGTRGEVDGASRLRAGAPTVKLLTLGRPWRGAAGAAISSLLAMRERGPLCFPVVLLRGRYALPAVIADASAALATVCTSPTFTVGGADPFVVVVLVAQRHDGDTSERTAAAFGAYDLLSSQCHTQLVAAFSKPAPIPGGFQSGFQVADNSTAPAVVMVTYTEGVTPLDVLRDVVMRAASRALFEARVSAMPAEAAAAPAPAVRGGGPFGGGRAGGFGGRGGGGGFGGFISPAAQVTQDLRNKPPPVCAAIIVAGGDPASAVDPARSAPVVALACALGASVCRRGRPGERDVQRAIDSPIALSIAVDPHAAIASTPMARVFPEALWRRVAEGVFRDVSATPPLFPPAASRVVLVGSASPLAAELLAATVATFATDAIVLRPPPAIASRVAPQRAPMGFGAGGGGPASASVDAIADAVDATLAAVLSHIASATASRLGRVMVLVAPVDVESPGGAALEKALRTVLGAPRAADGGTSSAPAAGAAATPFTMPGICDAGTLGVAMASVRVQCTAFADAVLARMSHPSFDAPSSSSSSSSSSSWGTTDAATGDVRDALPDYLASAEAQAILRGAGDAPPRPAASADAQPLAANVAQELGRPLHDGATWDLTIMFEPFMVPASQRWRLDAALSRSRGLRHSSTSAVNDIDGGTTTVAAAAAVAAASVAAPRWPGPEPATTPSASSFPAPFGVTGAAASAPSPFSLAFNVFSQPQPQPQQQSAPPSASWATGFAAASRGRR
jgi:hypothetical protein